MAENVLILGETGTGKSTSIRLLPQEKTFIIKATKKSLPFVKGDIQFKKQISTHDHPTIIKALKALGRDDRGIQYIVIDDFQYIMSLPWMNSLLDPKTKDSEFTKYKEIAYNVCNIITECQKLPENMIIFFCCHSEVDEYGISKIKTIGKLLNDKITLEGLFTIVLNTAVRYDKPLSERYVFQTQNNGHNTSKSPMGMFSEDEISNDLLTVAEAIYTFKKGE
jgi:hypothetical protein